MDKVTVYAFATTGGNARRRRGSKGPVPQIPRATALARAALHYVVVSLSELGEEDKWSGNGSRGSRCAGAKGVQVL